ncbi:hypothetical protein [Streptomyces synnematoformans]
MRRTLYAVAAVSVSLLAGCGGQESGRPDAVVPERAGEQARPQGATVVQEDWPPAVPASGLTKGMVLPLEKYMVTYAEEMAVQEARDNIELLCMRRFGFSDWATEPIGTSPPPASTAANMPRRYGLTDLAVARQYGQHPPETGSESTPPASREDPAALAVYEGVKKDGTELKSYNDRTVPEDGCLGEVQKTLPNIDPTLVEELNARSFTESQGVPAVREAMDVWSSCMNVRGFDVASVWDVENLYDETTTSASQDEIRLAVAEVECKQQSDLVGVWFREESAIQERLITENKEPLELAQTIRQEALTDARKVNARFN